MYTKNVKVVCDFTTKNIIDWDAMVAELKSIPSCILVDINEIVFEFSGFNQAIELLCTNKAAAKAIVEKYTQDRLVNLCDTCKLTSDICDAIDKKYGDGPGNDNVIKCGAHKDNFTVE